MNSIRLLECFSTWASTQIRGFTCGTRDLSETRHEERGVHLVPRKEGWPVCWACRSWGQRTHLEVWRISSCRSQNGPDAHTWGQRWAIDHEEGTALAQGRGGRVLDSYWWNLISSRSMALPFVDWPWDSKSSLSFKPSLHSGMPLQMWSVCYFRNIRPSLATADTLHSHTTGCMKEPTSGGKLYCWWENKLKRELKIRAQSSRKRWYQLKTRSVGFPTEDMTVPI